MGGGKKKRKFSDKMKITLVCSKMLHESCFIALYKENDISKEQLLIIDAWKLLPMESF